MNKTASIVIAFASVVIAFNMTYSNLHKTVQESPKALEEKVLPVVGRAWAVFDGLGASTGFLVKDGDHFKVAPYDSGSMAETFEPKYLTEVKFSNGVTTYNPITVDAFH